MDMGKDPSPDDVKLTDHQANVYFLRFFTAFMMMWAFLIITGGR